MGCPFIIITKRATTTRDHEQQNKKRFCLQKGEVPIK